MPDQRGYPQPGEPVHTKSEQPSEEEGGSPVVSYERIGKCGHIHEQVKGGWKVQVDPVDAEGKQVEGESTEAIVTSDQDPVTEKWGPLYVVE